MAIPSYKNFGSALFLSIAVAAGAAACGSSGDSGAGTSHGGTGASAGSSAGAGASHTSSGTGTATGGAGSSGAGTGGVTFATSAGNGGSATQGFDVTPTGLQTLSVTVGAASPPTVTYHATLDGQPIAAGWGLDLGNVATIPAGPSKSAVFTPTGNAGGLVTVTAGLNGKTVTRQVMVKLTEKQNGPNGSTQEQSQIPTTVGQIVSGGGVGGVGGEGLGSAVTDMPTLSALGSPTMNGQAQGLTFLYPYDKTVFPRGILAPLLMWSWSVGDADAIQIGIKAADGSFTYTGTFGKPAILAMEAPPGNFIRMPIPQDVWAMATNTAGGPTNPLTISLTVAKGGVGYGPITETWTVAPALLDGIIYYQSYGTQLAQNLCCNIGSTTRFGGAVLSIHVGDSAPKIAAGGTSVNDSSGCRVCHSVASGGARLIAVDGDNESLSTVYNLSVTGTTSQVMTHLATYPAMYPDGSTALTEGGLLLPLPNDATPIATTGLTSVVTDLGEPAFSPDGAHVAFNPQAGTLKNAQTLYVMSFDSKTFTFSGQTLIADDTSAASAQVKPGWPAFFPDSKSVVYHHQSLTGIENDLGTRAGNHAQIYWTDLTGPASVTPLDNLNGKGYLPKLAAPSTMTCMADGYSVAANPSGTIQPNLDHSDDVDMNYEPTVNPVASGGYAWVVFTSRRMYGSVATIPPYCSDPRGVNLTAQANPNDTNITPKKLWVAAVDLTQAPGTDSSHPAFYLPGQELLAGNARGFWVLDPCQADGTSCMTGDQCCNGYCEANGDGGALVCSDTPPDSQCSMPGNKCTTAANCCDASNLCIDGFCTQSSPG